MRPPRGGYLRDGEVVETKSWLVQPEGNAYHHWNTKVHDIRLEDTVTAPCFPMVWAEIEQTYLGEYNTFVAHNAPSDGSCLEHAARLYGIPPEIKAQARIYLDEAQSHIVELFTHKYGI